jgi:DegV family protein with EDD domain
MHDGKTFRDGVDITPAQFYEILSTSREMPTTSAPPPEVYVAAYGRLADEGKEILVICPSHKLTHVYESASIAAHLVREKNADINIEILDSGTAAAAQGFVALDAARAAQSSASLSQVLEITRDTMKKVHVIVFLDTLDYLARSGRIASILARVNALLKIKPMIELKPLGAGVVPIDRVRTRSKAMERLIKIIERRVDGKPMNIAVQHTNCLEEAIRLERYLKAQFNCKDIFVQDFTPVMGLHTGPGLIGVAYYPG